VQTRATEATIWAASSWRRPVEVERETDVKDTPKSSSCHPDLDGMMMILGCPENRQKTHMQQVMEPSVADQCQNQTKKTLITDKWHSFCVAP
jgi:hypothetical protein